MRIPFAFATCSSLAGLCILGTLGACVGDDPVATTTTTTQDAGTDSSSTPDSSSGMQDGSSADAATDAGPPPSTGTHKWVKSYASLYAASAVATSGEDTFAAGEGFGAALDIDGIATPAGTTAILVKHEAKTGKAAWAKSFLGTGGTANLRASAVSANAGGAYMTGFFDTNSLAVGTDTLVRSAGRAAFVVSLAPSDGATKWGRSIQTLTGTTAMSCTGIAANADGVAVGCTVDQTTIKVGTMAASTDYPAGVTAAGSDVVIVMFDLVGGVKWVNYFTGGADEKLAALTTDPSGDIVLLASTSSAMLSDKLTPVGIANPGGAGVAVPYLARLSAKNGQVSWSKFLGTGGVKASGIAVSSDGKLVGVAGTVTASTDLGIGALAPVGAGNSGDAFVVVLDAINNRTPVWQSVVAGSGNKGPEEGHAVAFDAFGQVIFGGLNRSSDTKVGSMAITSPPQTVDTGWGSFAVKYDPSGKVLWTKGFASQNLSDAISIDSVAFTASGEVRAAGGLQGTAPLDGTNNTIATAGYYQSVVWAWAP